MTRFTTRQDVTAEITTALGEYAAEFDIDQIADRAFEYAPELGGFIQTVDTDGLWDIAEDAALPVFTGEFQDDAWTAPADAEHDERTLETFLITPDTGEAEDTDMLPTHRGGALMLQLAIPVTDTWEPDTYAAHLEAAGWEVLRAADDAADTWTLTPARAPQAATR